MAPPEDRDELDCADVVEAVYLYLDGELSAEAIDGIRDHLDECSPCLREYGIEQEVKTLLVRCCCETAPDALRASVLRRIQVVRSELSITEIRMDLRTD
jgi:mycothiol system anti-sigma-R factor